LTAQHRAGKRLENPWSHSRSRQPAETAWPQPMSFCQISTPRLTVTSANCSRFTVTICRGSSLLPVFEWDANSIPYSEDCAGYNPPIFRIKRNACTLNGMTDKRDCRTSAIFFSADFALISRNVTGRRKGFSGTRSTALQSPSFAVASRYAVRATFAIPTTPLSSPLW